MQRKKGVKVKKSQKGIIDKLTDRLSKKYKVPPSSQNRNYETQRENLLLRRFKDELQEIKEEIRDEIKEWIKKGGPVEKIQKEIEKESVDILKQLNSGFSYVNRRINEIESKNKHMAEILKEKENFGMKIKEIMNKIEIISENKKIKEKAPSSKIIEEVADLRRDLNKAVSSINRKIDSLEEELWKGKEIVVMPNDDNPFTKIMKEGIKYELPEKEKGNSEEEENIQIKKLKDYLKNSLKKGYNKEELVKSAVALGWKKELVENILKK